MIKNDYLVRKCLLLQNAWLKTLRDWFHAAHHVSNGSAFAGDHVNLFGKIYEEIQDEFDGAVEKTVGLTNDKRLACPILLGKTSMALLEKYQSPAYDTQDEIINNAFNLVQDYIQFLEEAFKVLEEKDSLTLGLNDQLAGSANTHEGYLYLLQQRRGNAPVMKESKATVSSLNEEVVATDLGSKFVQMIKKQMRRTDDIPTVKKIGLAYDAILDVINDDEVSQKSWLEKQDTFTKFHYKYLKGEIVKHPVQPDLSGLPPGEDLVLERLNEISIEKQKQKALAQQAQARHDSMSPADRRDQETRAMYGGDLENRRGLGS